MPYEESDCLSRSLTSCPSPPQHQVLTINVLTLSLRVVSGERESLLEAHLDNVDLAAVVIDYIDLKYFSIFLFIICETYDM